MAMRKLIREIAFKMARHDLAMFLKDHEEDLLIVFREELQRLDDEIPEESFFIDINMVGLGEVILRAALEATRRFLTEEMPSGDLEEAPPVLEAIREDGRTTD